MSVIRSLIVLSLAAFALPFVVLSSHSQQIEATAETAQTSIQRHTVSRGNVELTIDAVGEIKADQTANLSMTRSGRVVEVVVESGDAVLAGDPLVRLDDTTARLSYDQAGLALQAAQLQLEDLLQGPDAGDVRIAQANVQSAGGSYSQIQNAVSPEDIQAAELRVQQAQQAYVDAHRARQVAGGHDAEAIAQLDAKIGEASFNLGIAQQQLAQLQDSNGPDLNAAGARVAQAQADLARVQAGPTGERIRSAEVAVEQAQADYDQAGVELNNYVLTAPYDGIVGNVEVEVGALVVPGSGLVQLVDLDPLQITVDVDEIDVRHVTEGMPAHVRIDALQDLMLDAQLERISLYGTTSADGVNSYPVDLTLTEGDPRVRPGMTAEATVVVDSRQNVVVVPNTYIRMERVGGDAFVNLIQPDGTLQEVPVELGLQGADQSEIVSGLHEGDVIGIDLNANRFGLFGG